MRRHDLVQLLKLGLGCQRAEDRVAGHETSVLVADLTQPEYSTAFIRRPASCAVTVAAVVGEKGKAGLSNGAAGAQTGVLLVLKAINIYTGGNSNVYGQAFESPMGTGAWAAANGNWLDTRIPGNAVGKVITDTSAVAAVGNYVRRFNPAAGDGLEIKLNCIIRPGWFVLVGSSIDNIELLVDFQWDEIDNPEARS